MKIKNKPITAVEKSNSVVWSLEAIQCVCGIVETGTGVGEIKSVSQSGVFEAGTAYL